VNNRLELLEHRRELLVARGALQRARVVGEFEALRSNLRFPRAAVTLAASPRARSLIAGAVLVLARRAPVGRLVRLAAIALAAGYVVRTALRIAAPDEEPVASREAPPQPDSARLSAEELSEAGGRTEGEPHAPRRQQAA